MLVPGLLSAGIGALIFIGLGNWTGLGTLSLSVPDLPPASDLTLGQIGWAVVIGAIGTVLGTSIRRLGLALEPVAKQHVMLVTPTVGLVMAALAIIFAQTTGHSTADVLYSGQSQLGPLLTQSETYSFGALVLLLVCKALAYGVALGSFRGGPDLSVRVCRRRGRGRPVPPARPAGAAPARPWASRRWRSPSCACR